MFQISTFLLPILWAVLPTSLVALVILRYRLKKSISTNSSTVSHTIASEKRSKAVVSSTQTELSAKISVNDARKRLFLKALGGASLGLFGAAIFPRSAKALVMGGTPSTSVVGVKDSSNLRIDPAKESGNLLSIKTSTDPLVVAGAGGYVRQDSTATIAKESNGNLATIAGKDFATQTTLATLATEDSSLYLRRIAKLTESLGTIDSTQRQRVAVEVLPTLAAVTTVATVSSVTNMVALGGVDGRYLYIDTARNAYANGIRGNLINS